MSVPVIRIPSYRHQKSRDLAVVCINGRDIYFGKYRSPESQRKYDKLIQEWLASGRVLTSETRFPPMGSRVRPCLS